MIKKSYFSKVVCCAAAMTLLSGSSITKYPAVAAEMNYRNAEIPPRMQPNTILYYINDNEYIIKQGGELVGNIYNENGLTLEEQAIVDARWSEVLAEYGDMDIIRIPNPAPTTDMVVYYDGDGFISNIVNPIVTYYTPLPRGTTKPNGIYTWGAHNNTLTITDNRIDGRDRITTFNDTIGENDNILVKGDVATKGEYDNPVYGQGIAVMIYDLNFGYQRTQQMWKRDNGSLPDAILDIWKDGVEYWGYTYSTSLSFDNGIYTYTR